MKIFKDYYRNYNRVDRCIWKGFVYMIPCDNDLIYFIPEDFFIIGKSKFIIRNGFYLIEKKRFERRFPLFKNYDIEIYDKDNEEMFK